MHRTAPHHRPKSLRDRGASLVEYALIVALIAAVCLISVQQLGGRSEDQLTDTAAGFSDGGRGDSASGSGSDSDAGADSSEGSGASSGTGSGSGSGSGSGTGSGSGSGSGASPADASGDTGPATDPKGTGEDPGPDVVPNQPKPESIIKAGSTDSRLYWWDAKQEEGEWVASATFTNTWIRHSYLTIEVVREYANGKTSTDKVREFYVPANGTATLDLWSNWIEGDAKDSDNVVSVRFEVTQVQTSDIDWKPQTFPLKDGATSEAEAPEVK